MSSSWGLGRSPSGVWGGAPAGCGAAPREENFGNFAFQIAFLAAFSHLTEQSDRAFLHMCKATRTIRAPITSLTLQHREHARHQLRLAALKAGEAAGASCTVVSTCASTHGKVCSSLCVSMQTTLSAFALLARSHDSRFTSARCVRSTPAATAPWPSRSRGRASGRQSQRSCSRPPLAATRVALVARGTPRRDLARTANVDELVQLGRALGLYRRIRSSHRRRAQKRAVRSERRSQTRVRAVPRAHTQI